MKRLIAMLIIGLLLPVILFYLLPLEQNWMKNIVAGLIPVAFFLFWAVSVGKMQKNPEQEREEIDMAIPITGMMAALASVYSIGFALTINKNPIIAIFFAIMPVAMLMFITGLLFRL